MSRMPDQPKDGGDDVPMPTERPEKGPYRFPSKEDDPDAADDRSVPPPVDDPDAEDEDDLDATGRFRVVELLNLPKTAVW